MNEMNIDLGWENVTLMVNGDECLIGFDEKRLCFYRLCSLKQFSSLDQLENDQLNFEKKFTEKILRLFLNRNETILTIETTEKLFFLLLPKFSSKKIHQCPIEEFPVDDKSRETIRLNFHWLTNKDFLLVFLTKNPFEYRIVRYSFQFDGQSKFVDDVLCSIGTSKEENFLRENLSFDQRSNLIQIDSIETKTKRKFFFIFIYKFIGEIFLLKLPSNLLDKNPLIGPLRLSPSRFDNYSTETTSTRILCSKTSSEQILLFTFNSIEINEFILLTDNQNEEEEEEEILYSIDRVCFHCDDRRQIRSIHLDRINSNCFYLIDSSLNIYSIEIPSLNGQQFSRAIEEIYSQRNFSFQRKHSTTIENHFNGNLFLFVDQRKSTERKTLEFVRRRRSTIKDEIRSNDFSSRLTGGKWSRRDFFDRIHSILHSQSEQMIKTDGDIQFNFLFDRIEKKLVQQEKIHREFENKQKFLFDLIETQKVVKQKFFQYFSSRKIRFDEINERFQRESHRHEHLKENVQRKYSSEEKSSISASNDENLFRQFEIQTNYLKEKFRQIESILFEQNQRKFDSTIDEQNIKIFEGFIDYYRNQILELNVQLKQLQNNRNE